MKFKRCFLRLNVLFLLIIAGGKQVTMAQSKSYAFLDVKRSREERIQDLIARLSLSEKVQMMKHEFKGIPRLGIPAYDWWNEALHGVARTEEKVTVYPQAIGMAATFNTAAVKQMGDYTATEGRALFNEDLKAGKTGKRYRGLTYWTPNINIFRDPRWGRGQETYGEDPYLTGQIGTAIVRGLEGDDPQYLKAVAAAKHYAVHSGPEHNRHSFNAEVSAYDLWDTYLPAFRQLVTKAKVHGIMCAYNRLDGMPCCGNNVLLNTILRHQWGFKGYVTSDCGGINDFASGHNTHPDNTAAVSAAVLAGTDLECGNLYQLLEQGVKQGALSEKDIDVSLARLLQIWFQLGMFDPQELVPYAKIGREVIESKSHKAHAYKMAQEAMVLLKNEHNMLPLDPNKIKRIALIGPNADNGHAQLANYFGTPSEIVTPLSSLQKRYGKQIAIDYFPGTEIMKKIDGGPSFEEIVKKAAVADVIVFVGGITADYEGEAGDAGAAGYGAFVNGDRSTMASPEVQTALLKELKKTGKPLVLVNMSGSVMSFDWESQHVDALLQAWYGGQAAGDAITDVLFGRYNPAGRMPLTTYKSDADLPDFEDYSMANRTYRYFRGEVRYPFGYGLSYTNFEYKQLQTPTIVETGTDVKVTVEVTNNGQRDGDEVVQLYVVHPKEGNYKVPNSALKGFKRVFFKKGQSQKITFTLTPEDLALVSEKGELIQKGGAVKIYVGGGQPGKSVGVETEITMQGTAYRPY